MDRLKSKKVLISLAVLVAILLVGSLVFLSQRNNSPTTPITASEEFEKISPDDIGLIVTLRKDKKALMFEITKAEDIRRIEYEITYDKEIDGEKVPEGLYGEMNIEEDGITKTDMREFGTCSSGVCRYDKVVSDVKITLKITKKNGKVYQAEKIISLK